MAVYDGTVFDDRRGVDVDADKKAVKTAMEKKLMVATSERGERRETPQRKCPLVQPEPSCRGVVGISSRNR